MVSPGTSGRGTLARASSRGWRIVWFVSLAALLVTIGYIAWPRPGPPLLPVLPPHLDRIDPEVATLVRRKAAQVQASPRDARRHASLGLVYEANTMWHEAADSFANALTLEPDEPLWAYHRAVALKHAGQIEAAHELLVDSADRLPESLGVQLRLAYTLLDEARIDEAWPAFERVIRLAPKRPEGYAGQGELMLARGDHAAAARLLEKALSLDPGLGSAHYSLGLSYRGLGRFEEAARELRLGLGAQRRTIPDHLGGETETYVVNYAGVIKRASELMNAGELAPAANMLEKLRRTRPDDPNILNNLGIAYMNMRQLDRALEFLLRAQKVDDGVYGTYQNIAACYRDKGELAQALKYARRAVELAPEVGDTHFALSRIQAMLGRLEDAYASGREALQLDPADHMKSMSLGELCVGLTRLAEARSHLEQVVLLAPEFLPAHLYLIRVLVELRELDRAQDQLRTAESLAPDHPRVLASRELIDAARNGQPTGRPRVGDNSKAVTASHGDGGTQ